MDGAGDEFLAGPGIAGDEHCGFRGCHLSDGLQQIQHGGALTDNILAIKMPPQAFFQQAVFFFETGVLH